jgi:hypothetical protein
MKSMAKFRSLMNMRYGWLVGLLLFSQSVTALTCGESSYLQSLINKQQYTQAIQVLDECLAVSGQVVEQDNQLFNQLLEKILHQYDISNEQVYRNFHTVFQVQPLHNLQIRWAKDLENDYPFADIKLDSEKYYFYYDTGRLQAQGRGLALTDKAIIWKNMLGNAQRLEFEQIQQLELLHEYGLSLTGWKLRVNQNQDIRLSQLADNTLIPFLSALFYFIQSHSEQDIQLIISVREKMLLSGGVTLCNEVLQQADLKEFNSCLSQHDEFELSEIDRQTLKTLTNDILQQTDVNFDQAYQHFQDLLAVNLFKGFEFQFKDNQQSELFGHAPKGEMFYWFYYDTGRLFAKSRGLALTKKSLLWKNLLSEQKQVKFINIQSISLLYESGLSLSGWKLRLNNNPELDIRLSQLSVDNVVLFAKALVYFINTSRKQFFSEQPLLLTITPEAQLYLETTFIERHEDDLKAASSMAVQIGAQLLLQIALF